MDSVGYGQGERLVGEGNLSDEGRKVFRLGLSSPKESKAREMS